MKNVERDPDSKVFADEICESFSGYNPHPAIHLLHREKRYERRKERPEQPVAVVCPGNQT